MTNETLIRSDSKIDFHDYYKFRVAYITEKKTNLIFLFVTSLTDKFENIKKEGSTAAMHFQPGNCMQCDIPTCVQACPTGSTFKDEKDGVVKVNERLCIGCGSCIPACPYGARFRHPEKKIVDKCDFCEHRRVQGDLPACVTTCPTKARVFGDLNDPESDVTRLMKKNNAVQVVHSKSNTKPVRAAPGGRSPSTRRRLVERRTNSPVK